MDESKIVVGAAADRGSNRWIVESPAVWKMIAPLGAAFFLVGLVDIGLSWYPVQFGSPEWEFGTIGTTLNNLPLPTLGVVLLGAWAAVSEKRSLVMTFGVVLMVIGAVLAGLVVIYLLTLPPALNAVNQVDNASAVVLAKKGIAKSVVQGAVYPLAFLWVGWRAFRAAQSR